MRSRVQRLRVAFAADDKARRCHRTRDDTQHTLAGRRRTLPVNDDFLLHAIDYVFLFPREVVMVLQVEQHLRAEVRRHVLVDEGVVGRGVAAHQFHRFPILLAFLRIQRQPGQPLQLAGKIRKLAERQLAVVIAHRRTGSAAAAVRQQCQVSSRLPTHEFARGR